MRAIVVPDLTGVYTADDGSVYYVRQIGEFLWWAGMSTESELGALDFHTGLQFTNVFHGRISGDTIDGEWADVPRGQNLLTGRLTLRFSDLSNVSASMLRIFETGGFGPSQWTKRIVVNTNPAACENASSTNIVCKFDRVTKSNGGTLHSGGDLDPYKDNVVVFGQVTSRADLNYPANAGRSFTDAFCTYHNDEDGDFTFDIQVERANLSGTGLDQLGGFWSDRWLRPPGYIIDKLDHHFNLMHVEAIMYGSTGTCGTDPGTVLLPGWMQNGANSVLVNGQPVNGAVDARDVPKEADIRGYFLGPNVRVRVTGVLVLDCGHIDCDPPGPDEMGVEIHPVYSIDVLNDPFMGSHPGSTGTVTGAWAANDQGTYYVRQVGTTVWWLGLSRDRGGSFANVFHGTIQGDTITGDWADVPMGWGVGGSGFTWNSGHLSLLGAGGGASTTKLAKDANASTGAFGAQLWEKLYDR